ncbi:MAG: CPBP family intramembrane metalloprotease, partial [Thaumarchaeota archaeon]|nr:CPBP family intramembrane metalloprotease [Nitrososphaerota archaeon]
MDSCALIPVHALFSVSLVYIASSAMLSYAARASQNDVQWMAMVSAFLLVVVVPFARPRFRRDRPIQLRGLRLPLILFTLAYILHLGMLIQFGFPWEKGAVFLLVTLLTVYVHRTSLSAIGVTSHQLPNHLVTGAAYAFSYLALLYISIYALHQTIGITVNVNMIPNLWGSTFWYSVFSVSTAVSEEALFRGYAITSLSRTYRQGNALILSSLLFGVWHTALPISYYQGLTLTMLAEVLYQTALHGSVGMVFGALYLRTGSITAPIILHLVWNIIIGAFRIDMPNPILTTAAFGLASLTIYILITRLTPTRMSTLWLENT